MKETARRPNFLARCVSWLLDRDSPPRLPDRRTRPVRFDMPKSHNPFSAYSADQVPQPDLTNSPLLDQLIRDGKLYLSLKGCHPAGARKQSRSGHRPVQPADREHGYIAHPGGRNFPRRECRRGARNSRRRSWRLRHGSSRSRSGWHDRRRRRSRRGRIRIGAIHLGHGHAGRLVRSFDHRLGRR